MSNSNNRETKARIELDKAYQRLLKNADGTKLLMEALADTSQIEEVLTKLKSSEKWTEAERKKWGKIFGAGTIGFNILKNSNSGYDMLTVLSEAGVDIGAFFTEELIEKKVSNKIENLVEKKVLSRLALKFVPVIGWISTGMDVFNLINQAAGNDEISISELIKNGIEKLRGTTTDLPDLDMLKKGILQITMHDGTIYARPLVDMGGLHVLLGGTKSDVLFGGSDKDILMGHGGGDLLIGGAGADDYFVNAGDIIDDSDKQGRIFDGYSHKQYTGGTYDKDRGCYLSNGNGWYKMEGDDLLINGNIRVKHFNKENNDLGITLLEADEIAVSLEGKSSVAEGDGGKHYEEYDVRLNRLLQKGEWLILKTVDPGGKERYIFQGDMTCESAKPYYEKLFFKQSYGAYLSWSGNDKSNEDVKTMVGVSVYAHSDNIKVKSITPREVTIKDDDRDPDDPETDGSPIVIDLNNDGINTLSLDYTRNFDLDNNGFAEATGWVQKDDALLAYDRNGNGKIDNGGELFGNYTLSDNYYSHTSGNTNGFNALKEFDTNNDGIIDKNDKDFDKILLWQDKNSNAVTDEGELIKLSDKVRSIDLNYKEISTDNNGNSIRQTSTATLNDGTKVKADDVWFKVSLNKTKEIIDQDKIPLETQALPQVIASGNLNSLRVAASKNETLATMINLYLMLSPEDRKKYIDELIYEWAGVSEIAKDSRGIYAIDARNLVLYEKLTGKPFNQGGWGANPGPNAYNRINDKINTFKYYVYASIELQTTYSDLNLDMEKMSLREDGKLSYKFDTLNSKLMQLYKDGKYDEIIKLMSIVREASVYKPIYQGNLKENLKAFCGNDDKFLSLCLSTYISGTDGNDIINGNSENNFIVGGKGNDTLYGGYGNDTYIFNKGDGTDIIYDTTGNDKIQFRESIAPNDVSFKRELDKLIIQIKSNDGAGSNSITIQNFFSVNPGIGKNTVRTIIFADGTVYDFNKILELTPLSSTDKDDKLYLTDGNDTFDAGLGKDEIWGGNGDDVINGGGGNDILYGNDGNDTIIGGKGNDILNGGYGDDTYIFNKGDGADIITDYGGNNILKLSTGLDKKDLIISQNFIGSILFSFKNNTSDSITFNQNIQTIEFANGDKMNIDEIKKLSIIGDDTDNTIYGYYNENNTIIGNRGNDMLCGGTGNDIYVFNKGDGADTIIDHDGNDMIKFNDFSANDISLRQEFNDVVITSKDSNDKITIKDFYDNNGNATSSIKKIIFNDNSVWDYQTIINNSSIKATEESDKFYLSDKDDIFDALGGDDEIYGEDGNDTLIGGIGNDTLNGGCGDDTYIFNKGDGADIIEDWSGTDTIKFGEGIRKEDLIVLRNISKNAYGHLDGTRDIIIKFKHNETDSITLKNVIMGNKTNASASIENFLFANGESLSFEDIKRLSQVGSDKNDVMAIYDDIEKNILIGGGGNDELYGQDGNDILSGGTGSDLLDGGIGNDTLIGGKDDDTLNGGYGDDTYIFNKGDGNDTITDNQGTDTIKFGEGISKEDLIVKRVARIDDRTGRKEYSDIVIFFKNSSNDSITLRDAAYSNAINENNIIETFEFANGGKLNFEDIKKLSLIGSDSSENIVGYVHTHNIIKGEGGDDKLYGQGWNDTMYGGDGNDLIEGGSGNDTLIGDRGNDTLNGGADNDTYVYNKGDGNDIIEEWGGIDTIKFGEGIQKKDLIISRDMSKNSYYLSNVKDIIIKFKYNETDSITLKNVINANKTGIYSAIENFEFANGEKLSFEDIKQLSLVGTDEGETINGFEDSNNTLIGNGGNDWLYGDKKNDILIGGEGDDHLRGNEGDDTYVYNIGDGNDTIHDYEGEDIIKFGKGINKEDIIVTKGEVKYDSYTRSSYQDLVISLKGKQGSISLEHIISRDNGIYEKYSHKTLVFENGDKLSFDDILKLSLIGNDENNDIYGYSHRDNILEGNGGDDALYGNIGNDTLIGGKGNDGLYGNGGDDTYVYNKGDGVDYIYDIEGNDTLKFGKGIKKEDLVVSVSKNKEKLSQYDDTHRVMYIKIGFKNNDTDAVFLRGNKDLAIENFEFENGDRLSFEDIKKLALTGDDTNNLLYGYDDINNVMNGLGGDDEIQGGELNDTIYGGTGNDTISGDKGDDTIYGGEGNDTINGGSGDDIIEGGKGDDVIKGGWGDDIYIFNKGDGNDTIADYEGTDTLQLGEGITKDDIIAKHTPQGTIIKFKNSKNDSISFGHFGIDRIKFANGEELSSEDIEKLELIGTDEADTIFGNSDQDNLIIGGKGDDILYGSYPGNNIFIYNQGDGADTIYAGAHENKIKFGKGINKEDLIVERCVNTDARDYDNLKISFRNSAGDSIMLTYIIKDNINAQEIQTFEFANGDKLNFGDIKRLSLIGTAKNDELRGYNDMDNEIKGGDGNDILIGGNGVNNILEGGSGNDTLRGCYDSYGNPGISMNGKNTFVFSRGDGNDMVENFKDNDLIKFKDIGSNEVKFNLNLVDNSLLISDKLSNSSVLIKNYDVRTNLNFQFKDGKILGSDFISGQVKPIDGGNTMVGGKEDNVFIYDGGAKTIMDLGGYDKVIYKNPVKRVRYDFGKNGSSDLKLIITPADPNAKNDILEVKGFFSNRDNVIEEFHIGKYLNIKAADIYKAFGKTYIASAKPTALAMDAKLDIDNETQISPLSKSSSDGSNSKSGWDMVLGSGDKNELKAIVSKFYNDADLSTSELNSALSPSGIANLSTISGISQEDALKENAFLSQDTVNKIIEQLNIYANNSEALEFNQRDIRKDDMQVYMS